MKKEPEVCHLCYLPEFFPYPTRNPSRPFHWLPSNFTGSLVHSHGLGEAIINCQNRFRLSRYQVMFTFSRQLLWSLRVQAFAGLQTQQTGVRQPLAAECVWATRNPVWAPSSHPALFPLCLQTQKAVPEVGHLFSEACRAKHSMNSPS